MPDTVSLLFYILSYPGARQVRKLDEPVGSRSVELEVAYGEDLGQGLLKVPSVQRVWLISFGRSFACRLKS